MNEQEVKDKLLAKKAEWEEAKANLSPHMAAHRGIDSLFDFFVNVLFESTGAGGDSTEKPAGTEGVNTPMVPVPTGTVEAATAATRLAPENAAASPTDTANLTQGD